MEHAYSIIMGIFAGALLIYAGIDGIQQELSLPVVADFDIYGADEATLAGYEKLPQSPAQAKALAAQSDFIREILPENLLRAYL